MDGYAYIKMFDPGTMRHRHVMILGKRQSGKTALVNHLLKDVPREAMLAVCPKGLYKVCDHAYEGAQMHPEYHDDLLDGIWRKKACVLDDCIYTEAPFKAGKLWHLMMNNIGISVVHTQSFPMKLPAILRSKLDCIFVFGRNSCMYKKRIYELYGHPFESYKEFDTILEELTKNPYHCMVIYNNEESSKLEDCVFWYVCNPT